ncbi:phytanoyl-CoA dioxygenase family protein [Nonomuraea pusilla]|uniref:Phytanoyl-CoA dioxygenase (PhyH) n=1 Tax=Nonomuraea pusilla TaxID=46177 RepID=A0A1H7RT85_9ACTN|nr:hypothetical protein [Nonomuraea pusilla]SEL63229.1 hypothetical protein SAMN05660976_02901 [Nonomuraea pusilla]
MTPMTALHRDGFLVLPGLLPDPARRDVRDRLAPLLTTFPSHPVRHAFGVLNHTRVLDDLIEHPAVLALLDRLLLPNFLLSQVEVVETRGGAPARKPYPDDRHYPLRRPRPALSVAALWTVSPGAPLTVWPGSHRWPEGRTPDAPGVPLNPPPGSCAVLLGTLWHGRAATPEHGPAGLTVTAHYCEPWLRTREAFTLSPGRDVARMVSPRLRRMLGYSVHPPDMGLVDGMHPHVLFA